MDKAGNTQYFVIVTKYEKTKTNTVIVLLSTLQLSYPVCGTQATWFLLKT